MRESTIERALVNGVKKLGGMCLKMSPTYNNGVPDRLILYKGHAYFVELKKPGSKPRKLQVIFAKELERVGHNVRVIDSLDAVSLFLVELGHISQNKSVVDYMTNVYVITV